VYCFGDEVAFNRKIPGIANLQDWILGKVTRVIGEGKSRRYEIQDPFPDAGSTNALYRSAPSRMVPIPAEGTILKDYEPGRRVLAQYPNKTTFYPAEVREMLNEGVRVHFSFEDPNFTHIVERRLVLDHKV
jgi:SAGA-associated factor 29